MLIVGAAIGFLGSLHCLSMCSPIAIIMHTKGRGIRPMLYNTGRIITYMLLGLLFGIVGQSIGDLGFQGILSILMGLVILAIAWQPKIKSRLNNSKFYSSILSPLRRKVLQSYDGQSYTAYFITGLLNGLLPCGLVYMAVTASLAAGSITGSLSMMVGFGLGTLPMMFAIGTAGKYLSSTFIKKINFALPAIAIILGIILISRGLLTNLPFLPSDTGITICQ